MTKDDSSIVESPSKAVPIRRGKTSTESHVNMAKVVTSPELAAQRVVRACELQTGLDDELDVPALMQVLKGQAAALAEGDIGTVEAMLMNQATALQSLFVRLVERGMTAGIQSSADLNLRLGLRAQAQCRATLQALIEMRRPSAVYAEQANIAHGHQQVNNTQNQVLGETDGERMDAGKEKAAGGDDSTLEAVGALDRAEDSGR